MIPGKALLVSVPLVLAGGILARTSHDRIGVIRGELAAADARGRAEAESYLRTLQGAHAQRQLDELTRRHELALRLATARRDRLLGALLALAGALAFVFVRVAQRIAAEIEETGRLPGTSARGGAGAGPPGGG